MRAHSHLGTGSALPLCRVGQATRRVLPSSARARAPTPRKQAERWPAQIRNLGAKNGNRSPPPPQYQWTIPTAGQKTPLRYRAFAHRFLWHRHAWLGHCPSCVLLNRHSRSQIATKTGRGKDTTKLQRSVDCLQTSNIVTRKKAQRKTGNDDSFRRLHSSGTLGLKA